MAVAVRICSLKHANNYTIVVHTLHVCDRPLRRLLTILGRISADQLVFSRHYVSILSCAIVGVL